MPYIDKFYEMETELSRVLGQLRYTDTRLSLFEIRSLSRIQGIIDDIKTVNQEPVRREINMRDV